MSPVTPASPASSALTTLAPPAGSGESTGAASGDGSSFQTRLATATAARSGSRASTEHASARRPARTVKQPTAAAAQAERVSRLARQSGGTRGKAGTTDADRTGSEKADPTTTGPTTNGPTTPGPTTTTGTTPDPTLAAPPATVVAEGAVVTATTATPATATPATATATAVQVAPAPGYAGPTGAFAADPTRHAPGHSDPRQAGPLAGASALDPSITAGPATTPPADAASTPPVSPVHGAGGTDPSTVVTGQPADPGGPAPGGSGQNGTGPNGTGPNGTGPNGTGPNGTGPNGTGPNGTAAGGTGPHHGTVGPLMTMVEPLAGAPDAVPAALHGAGQTPSRVDASGLPGGGAPVPAPLTHAAASASADALAGLSAVPPTSPGLPALGAPAVPAAPLTGAAAIPGHVAELARMARINADGSARLTVRLDPPELGAVNLHLTSRNGSVELSLRAETPAGAAALASQQTRVRDVLAGHGFDLARFTVVGSDTSNSPETRNRDAATPDQQPGTGQAAPEQRQPGQSGQRPTPGTDGDRQGRPGPRQDGSTRAGTDASPGNPTRDPASAGGMWL